MMIFISKFFYIIIITQIFQNFQNFSIQHYHHQQQHRRVCHRHCWHSRNHCCLRHRCWQLHRRHQSRQRFKKILRKFCRKFITNWLSELRSLHLPLLPQLPHKPLLCHFPAQFTQIMCLLYLNVSECVCCVWICLQASTYIYLSPLSLPTSTYIYLLQPTSTYLYLLVPTSTYIYLHLPTSIYFYLHLPTFT